jgi:hypothetical protein
MRNPVEHRAHHIGSEVQMRKINFAHIGSGMRFVPMQNVMNRAQMRRLVVQSTDRLPTDYAGPAFGGVWSLEMLLALLEVWFDRITRVIKVMSCIYFAGYVAWRSNFIIPEAYGDLAVPAVMALFVAVLVLIAYSLVNQWHQSRQ